VHHLSVNTAGSLRSGATRAKLGQESPPYDEGGVPFLGGLVPPPVHSAFPRARQHRPQHGGCSSPAGRLHSNSRMWLPTHVRTGGVPRRWVSPGRSISTTSVEGDHATSALGRWGFPSYGAAMAPRPPPRSPAHRWAEGMDPATIRCGVRARARRIACGLTVEELAHRTGLSTQTIGRVERAETSASIWVVGRLARGLGVEITSFFTAEIPEEIGASDPRERLLIELAEARPENMEEVVAIVRVLRTRLSRRQPTRHVASVATPNSRRATIASRSTYELSPTTRAIIAAWVGGKQPQVGASDMRTAPLDSVRASATATSEDARPVAIVAQSDTSTRRHQPSVRNASR
jgi:transcriptional regulator with XRE-family HTH domain